MKKIMVLVLVGLLICPMVFAKTKVKEKDYSTVIEEGVTKLKMDVEIIETSQETYIYTMAELNAALAVAEQRKAKVVQELADREDDCDLDIAEIEEAISEGEDLEID